MHQIIEASIKAGRKIVMSGRSMDQTVRIGTELGYLPFGKENYVNDRDAFKLDQSKLTYLIFCL